MPTIHLFNTSEDEFGIDLIINSKKQKGGSYEK